MKTHRSNAAVSLRQLAEHVTIGRQPAMAHARIDGQSSDVASASRSAVSQERQREIQREAMQHVAMLLERDRRRTRNRLLLAAGMLMALVLLASQRPMETESSYPEALGQTSPLMSDIQTTRQLG